MEAFGHPGMPPTWSTARKIGVGTALTPQSRVWFTLARGIVTEVYYPRVDLPNLRDLQFLVSDSRTFVHEEQFDLEHTIERLSPFAPAYRIVSADPQGRYRLVKTVITDPEADVLVVRGVFETLQGRLEDYALYILIAPQIKNEGWGNHGQVRAFGPRQVLVAWREDVALALVTSCALAKASVGFVGLSDGWQDLRNFVMDWEFAAAHDGHIALTGQLALPSSGQFTLALGFGPDVPSAAQMAEITVEKDFATLYAAYVAGWREWMADLKELPAGAKEENPELITSAMVLKTHEDKTHPGAFVASLSVPWGETQKNPNPGGYHLAWPRDLVHIATGLLALGDPMTPLNTLKYLAKTQNPDGSWPQNMWLDGAPYWRGLQLDEVALPVLLA